MRTFLGLLMVLIVSSDGDITINGVLEDNVLLPCSCLNRNLDKEVKWQMDEPKKSLVAKYNGSTHFSERYKHRATMFVKENSNNCSVLLTHITKDDNGKYKCIFRLGEQYTSSFVNLNISERSSPLTEPHQDLLTVSPSSRSACFTRHFKTIAVVVALGLSLMSEIFI